MITKHTKNFLVVSFICVLGVGLALGASVYFIFKDGGKLVNKSQLVADQNVQAQTYSALERLLQSSEKEREELHNYILTEDKTIGFLTSIENIAKEQGVSLVTDTLNVVSGKDFDTLEVHFTIEGEDTAVDKMITILENLPYASVLNHLSINRNPDKGTESSVELSVMLLKHDK